MESHNPWPGGFNEQQVDLDQPIAVLLSGGVDSAVALHRLHKAGYRRLHPFYLKIWLQKDDQFLGECPWEEDLHYADAVATSLGLRLRIEPMQQEYYQHVVQYTLDELRVGRTPSPDVLCNSSIKFGAFVQRFKEQFPIIASGHYANLVRNPIQLHRSPDPVKDQSYFLSRLNLEQLSRLLFPLAGMTKNQVRQCARQWQLANAQRADSQGICFLGKIHYSDFVRHHLGEKTGPIVEQDSGKILGRHRGYWFYTIGQRQGLGLGGGPWYVCGKRVSENTVYVAHAGENRLRRQFHLTQIHPLTDHITPGHYHIKLRHGPQLLPCFLEQQSGEWRVTLQQGDRGIAPGQFAVVYRQTLCCASGLIADECNLPSA